MSATFKVTSGPGGLQRRPASATPRGRTRRAAANRSRQRPRKVRNVSPIKINEFRIQLRLSATRPTRSSSSTTPAPKSVDISNWTLTEHPAQQAIFSAVKIPAGTKLAARRLLPARPLQLRTGGSRAGRRYHHPRQKHDRHVGRRYDQHRHRLRARRLARSQGSEQQPATLRRCGNRFPKVR